MNLTTTALIFGAALLAAGGAMLRIAGKGDSWWKTLPRERNLGTAIGLISLIWAARIATPMLEGGLAKFQQFLIPGAVILGIACWFLLEYVFARALGGIVILICASLMHLAFAEHAPARWALSLACYFIGTTGILMIGWPFLFRDWLERIEKHPRWRLASAGYVGAAGIAIAAVGLAHGVG